MASTDFSMSTLCSDQAEQHNEGRKCITTFFINVLNKSIANLLASPSFWQSKAGYNTTMNNVWIAVPYEKFMVAASKI